MHSFHALQWVKEDCSQAASALWKQQKDTAYDAAICARNVEDNPEDIAHWRNLVRCLGPVDRDQPMSHAENWWGTDREWWKDSILSIMDPARTTMSRDRGTATAVNSM